MTEDSSPKLSLAIPLHNEAGTLVSLYHEIKEVLDNMRISYEILFINDASTDKTPEILRQIKKMDKKVRVIEHQENYGEAAALSSGFKFARGDIIVTMDGDGQNDPRDLPLLVAKINEGYKAATGWRQKRKEKYLTRILPSVIANRMISLITGVNVHDNGCGLKAYRAELVREVIIPHGFHRFLPAVLGVKSEEVAEVRVKDRRRIYGKSHYGLSRIKEVIRELLTIRFVIHNPKLWCSRFRIICSLLLVLTLILGAWSLKTRGTSELIITLVSVGFTFISTVIFKNLKRVVAIREATTCRRKEW